MIPNPAVMSDMDIGHKIGLGANHGSLRLGTMMDRDVFPEDGPLANDDRCRVSLEGDILRWSPQDGSLEYLAIGSQRRSPQDLGMGFHFTPGSDAGGTLDDGIGADADVVSQLGIGINYGSGMYTGGNVQSSRSTTMAMSSASAASSPST